MKTVLITGVSRGIGKALAERFLKNGDHVIGTSTSGSADWSHATLQLLQLDLSDPESIRKCAEEVGALNTKIDILINNAGMVVDEEEASDAIVPDYLRRTIEVNLLGTVDFTERIVPFMAEGGHIINISSSAGSLANTSSSASLPYPSYRISKAALNMFTRTLALQLQGSVCVSSVHPGWVKTDMGGDEADISPEEAAEDIYALASSRPTSGQFWFKGKPFPW